MGGIISKRAARAAPANKGLADTQISLSANGSSQEPRLPEGTSIVFVLGGPGAGKGTQCARIVEMYGHTHLSAGDLLREEVASGSELSGQLQAIMKEGKLVPMEVIIGMLRAAMVKSGATKFLIDGFPRALDQAEKFEAMVQPCDMVLFFDCPEEVMEARLLKRGETSGRADDNAETIRKRFRTFQEQSLAVTDHYAAKGKCFKISAVPPPEEVFAAVATVMDGGSKQQAAAAKPAAPPQQQEEGAGLPAGAALAMA